MNMKRLIYFIPALLVAGGANAQTSYNNFVGKSKEKTVVMSAGDVKNITVNPDTPNTIDVNLADGTKNTMELGDEGDARFMKVSAEKLLGELYGYQYYGLPYSSNRTTKVSASLYSGKFDALTDLYQLHWDKNAVNTKYYGGTLNADSIPLYAYNSEMMWESVIKANELIKNVTSLSEEEAPDKDKIAAEAKCIIAMHYFDMFMQYGGLPIVTDVIPSANCSMGDNFSEGVNLIEKADIPGIHNRKSVAETVDYMVALLDEAIPYLDWEQSDIMTFPADRMLLPSSSSIDIETLRLNKAAAMALKAKILLFAASPFFNDNQPYLQAMTEEQKPLVWYGGYDSARWAKALAACQDFFNALSENGYYELVQAAKKNNAEYRKAFRLGYISSDSKEVLMKSRACQLYGTQGSYSWHNWGWSTRKVNRQVYSPTEEYAEMFGWSDGTPFRWDVDSLAGKVSGDKGKLFYEYKPVRGGLSKTASRDPRMYENMAVNGMKSVLLNWQDESDAVESGDIYELWRGGNDAQFDVVDMDGNVVEKFETAYPTGYGALKYQLTQSEFWRYNYPRWVSLSLNEMYLMYAEALAQNGNLAEAIAMVDVVRARVGLKSLATCYQSAYGVDLTSDKDLLIEEILRERACELGMSNNRFYDMVRYKRTDWMTRKLHGLAVERLYKNANNKWEERPTTWYGIDKDNGMTEPYVFNYRRFELKDGLRTMWGKDKDSDEVRRWLLSPLPQSEIDKGLGLIQNPGW